jgi:lysyl-tRNA synthetase class 2
VRATEQNIQVAGTSETRDFTGLKRLALGSIIRMWGTWGESKNKTPTLFLERFALELRPQAHLPDKYHGLTDTLRYRRRSLDLIVNEDAFNAARINADILHALRTVLNQAGYREFNTGILQEVFEGGLAKPFETVLDANKTPYYLSLTSELKLKRLVAAGFERVAEVTQSFRNEGLGRFHSPEFTLLEAYGVDQTLEDMLALSEECLRCAAEVAGVNAAKPARRTFAEVYATYVDASTPMSLKRLEELHPDKFHYGMPYFTWVMKVLEVLIGPNLLEPTFVIELPSALSPLAKKDRDNPEVTARAFLFGKGLFIADLYADENDPEILEAQLRLQARAKGSEVNEDYLEVVRMGIPPTAGMGLGVNRLQMFFLSDKLPQHIRETILFPLG